uniref:Uncharacterized protein n=1 Tax=Avena sativa TaxID=4498 RepID=A0ACD5VMZ5_AVESA
MAGQDKRISPPTPAVNGEPGAKKARSQQALVPVVKQEPRQDHEREEGEVARSDAPVAAAVAVAASAEALVALAPGPTPQIDMRFDLTLFHCQACLLPLKPPVFKCESGHVICCFCRPGHGEVCGPADIHCGELGAVVSAARVPCAYKSFGCDQYVVYHEAEQHKRACPHAPCSCPEPGCGFKGNLPSLLDHFAAVHARPIIAVRYGRPWNLSLPLKQRWHVVVGQEDQTVFLITLGDLGAAAAALSLVCVRADGAAAAAAGAPQFWCKLSVEHPGGDKDKVVLMASSVGSSTLSNGAPMPGQGMFLGVPHELMSGEALAVSVRIDQVHAVADAASAVAAKTIPPPPARTARKFH